LIRDGEEGFLCEVGDVEQQSARTIDLLTQPALHARMSVAARSSAQTRFSTERIIPLYEAYYEEVLRAART